MYAQNINKNTFYTIHNFQNLNYIITQNAMSQSDPKYRILVRIRHVIQYIQKQNDT